MYYTNEQGNKGLMAQLNLFNSNHSNKTLNFCTFYTFLFKSMATSGHYCILFKFSIQFVVVMVVLIAIKI